MKRKARKETSILRKHYTAVRFILVIRKEAGTERDGVVKLTRTVDAALYSTHHRTSLEEQILTSFLISHQISHSAPATPTRLPLRLHFLACPSPSSNLLTIPTQSPRLFVMHVIILHLPPVPLLVSPAYLPPTHIPRQIRSSRRPTHTT